MAHSKADTMGALVTKQNTATHPSSTPTLPSHLHIWDFRDPQWAEGCLAINVYPQPPSPGTQKPIRICLPRLDSICAVLQESRLLKASSGLVISPGSSVHGIFQARTLKWVALSFSRASS